MAKRLEVLKATTYEPELSDPFTAVVPFAELRSWMRSPRFLTHVLRYTDVRLRTDRLETLPKPFATAVILRMLCRGGCETVDSAGRTETGTALGMVRLARDLVRDATGLRALLGRTESVLDALEAPTGSAPPSLDRSARPLYVRSDLVFGLEAGGSVGHIAGVLNNLESFVGEPVFVTSDRIPTVSDGIDVTVVAPEGRFRDFTDAPTIAYNETLVPAIRAAASQGPVAFVYQRYSAYNYSGLAVARSLRVPFVLEYNGSEVWIARNWGRPLKYEALGERIELLNLRSAELIVVVSEVMRDELVERGIDPQRILVNPNGVDPDRYSPDVDGTHVRQRLGLEGSYIVGFIGTFGKWHGAENLAHAFEVVMTRRPDLRDRLRLLMIGDGMGLPATRAIIEGGRFSSAATFTGRIPQEQGPAYLAACDLLVSPHVPNPDGSRFFGSPTKLFEYMAMGKPIVASGLDQIADVLEDERTAFIVEPGSVSALASGIERAINEPELAASLGIAARAQAVDQHSWHEHTRRIVDRLGELCA